MPGQKEVLWNAGENVGNLDLNNMQRFLRSAIADMLMGSFGAFVDFVPGSPSYELDRRAFAWCIGDSCAPYPSATSLQISNLGGPLIQWQASANAQLAGSVAPANWGLDPYALVYWANPADLQVTHAAGNGSNPRWDMVSFNLSTVSTDVADQETRLTKQVVGSAFVISSLGVIKRRKVKLTVTVTQGTPAVSPTIPTPPAGDVALYMVKVPTSFAGAFPLDANFWDQRMPLGSYTEDVYLSDMIALSHCGSGAALSVANQPLNVCTLGTPSSSISYLVPKLMGHGARLIGVSALTSMNSTLLQFRLARMNSANSGSTFIAADGGTGNGFLTGLGSSGSVPSLNSVASTRWQTQQIPGVGAGLNLTQPFWSTGWNAGYASRAERAPATDNTFDRLGMQVTNTSAGGSMVMCRFRFAGGPL